MALSSLLGQVSVTASWKASINITGSDYSPITNNSTINKILSLTTNVTPTTAGGADVLLSQIVTVSPSSVVNFTLNSFTDICGETITNLARVQCLIVRLLSTTDDSVNGTAAVSILVGQNGGSSSNLWQGFGTSGNTNRVYNGEIFLTGGSNGAGVVVSGSAYILRLTNEDASNSAAVELTVFGGDS